MNNYADIIHCERPTSRHHPPMSRADRAAQFAPYAALVGHKDIISAEETDYLTQEDPDHIIIDDENIL